MKKIVLYSLWAVLYIICFALGCIPAPGQGQAAAMTVMSVIFFIPGILLLVDSLRKQDKKLLVQLRWISGLSLGLTVVMLIANFMSVNASETTGTVLYYILNFVSVPMVCSRHFVLSLFLWACILVCTLPKRKSVR